MRVGFSCWENRIAPVFDTAHSLRIVETESGKIVRETDENLPDGPPMQTALDLAEMRLDALVCGAISGALHTQILAYGIHVIPFVAGDLQQVVYAWISHRLDPSSYAMPGCGRRRRHRYRRGASAGNRGWGKMKT